MPFRGKDNGKKQRGFMWANHPDIARRWTEEEKAGKSDEKDKEKPKPKSKSAPAKKAPAKKAPAKRTADRKKK